MMRSTVVGVFDSYWKPNSPYLDEKVGALKGKLRDGDF
jgi:hypothetical protein